MHAILLNSFTVNVLRGGPSDQRRKSSIAVVEPRGMRRGHAVDDKGADANPSPNRGLIATEVIGTGAELMGFSGAQNCYR